MASVPLLSLAIWVPILAGLAGARRRRTGKRAATQRWIALGGAVLGFLVTIPLYTRFDLQSSGMPVRRARGLDRALQHLLPPRRGRHLGAVRAAQQLHHHRWW